jgi:hypothetical protein
MKKSLITFLSFLSLFLLLPACYMSPYKAGGKIDYSKQEYQEIRPFQRDFNKVLYQASLSISGKTFAGLMMIKKFSSDTYRIAFFSELGLNFFDFELRRSANKNKMQLTVNNIYAQLDRKLLINRLEKYFSMLLNPGLEDGIYKTFVAKDGSHVLVLLNSYKGKDAYHSKNLIEPYDKIVNFNSIRRQPKILISITGKRLNYAPSKIVFEEPGLRMRIELDQSREHSK